MKYIFVLGLMLFFFAGYTQEILPADIQIKTALQAAPEDQRSDATVLGYAPSGQLVTLRKGTGRLVCLADDPLKEGISVACYSANLEPFMARGRALLAAGKTEKEKQEIRNKEIEDGQLKIPREPNILYVLNGSDSNYDKKTGELKNGNIRYAFYVPFATLESTGMSARPSIPGMPWLMEAGTAKAHIMIVPQKKQ